MYCLTSAVRRPLPQSRQSPCRSSVAGVSLCDSETYNVCVLTSPHVMDSTQPHQKVQNFTIKSHNKSYLSRAALRFSTKSKDPDSSFVTFTLVIPKTARGKNEETSLGSMTGSMVLKVRSSTLQDGLTIHHTFRNLMTQLAKKPGKNDKIQQLHRCKMQLSITHRLKVKPKTNLKCILADEILVTFSTY